MPSTKTRPRMKKEINEILKLTGWNQSRLAKECGVDRATITRWLDDRNPSGLGRVVIDGVLARARRGEFREPAAAAL